MPAVHSLRQKTGRKDNDIGTRMTDGEQEKERSVKMKVTSVLQWDSHMLSLPHNSTRCMCLSQPHTCKFDVSSACFYENFQVWRFLVISFSLLTEARI